MRTSARRADTVEDAVADRFSTDQWDEEATIDDTPTVEIEVPTAKHYIWVDDDRLRVRRRRSTTN